jgi:hypothetical protein
MHFALAGVFMRGVCVCVGLLLRRQGDHVERGVRQPQGGAHVGREQRRDAK